MGTERGGRGEGEWRERGGRGEGEGRKQDTINGFTENSMHVTKGHFAVAAENLDRIGEADPTCKKMGSHAWNGAHWGVHACEHLTG